MSVQDPTVADTSTPDDAPPTQVPTSEPPPPFDSLLTRGLSSYPDTRNDPFDPSIPTRIVVDPYASASPEAATLRAAPPDAFPGFELLETLGEGGMGVVYKARQGGLNRLVALKVILGVGGPGRGT